MGGLFYYVLASSDTLGEALQRGVRYSAIVAVGNFQQGFGTSYLGFAGPLAARHQLEPRSAGSGAVAVDWVLGRANSSSAMP